MPDSIEGWKAIAEYFGRGVRTVQLWERESGLPVHRLQKRVLAYTKELEEWRRNHTEITHSTEAVEHHETEPGVRRSGPWLFWSAAALVLAISTLGAARFFAKPERIIGFRIQGNELIATGPGDREVWHRTISRHLGDAEYTAHDLASKVLIADLHLDGGTELIFPEFIGDPPPVVRVDCFSMRGKREWEFVPGHTVTDAHGHIFQPPFGIEHEVAVHGRGTRFANVVFTSAHNFSFADQVAVVDGRTGRLLSEYWHHGHLNYMIATDLDGDGEPEVLLGGVNDSPSYDQATVLVFDHRDIQGASTSRDGTPDFKGMGAGSEKAIIRFPRSPVSAGAEFNRVKNLAETEGHIVVTVAEGTSVSTAPCVIYEFDRQLTPVNVGLCEDFADQYLGMRAKNPKLPTLEELLAQLMLGVSVW